LDPAVGSVEIYPQEFTRVLLNLVSNGFYAAAKRKAEGADASYEPTLMASTRALADGVEIRIRDNGTGSRTRSEPRCSTRSSPPNRPARAQVSGSRSAHDIVVKQHGGAIAVETQPGVFTEFIITLPRSAPAADLRRTS
jgi:signal transduction histidine kinase